MIPLPNSIVSTDTLISQHPNYSTLASSSARNLSYAVSRNRRSTVWSRGPLPNRGHEALHASSEGANDEGCEWEPGEERVEVWEEGEVGE
jgi:hypothetical protein